MQQRLLHTLSFIFFIYGTGFAQVPSQRAAYEQAILRSIQDGTFEPEVCAHSLSSFPTQQQKACGLLNTGFGNNSWQPTSGPGGNGLDPACAVPAVPVPACLGGKYRVPIAITVFEDPSWPNANYLNGTGFAALPDADIDAAISNLNFYYANANIEFYEARSRQRVTNVDMYDFYTPFLGGPDPVTGGNDGVDDDAQTAAFDVSNIINLYFVGGLNGDHDASGVTGYAPLPSSRDYSIMAYRALFGTTLYHELGHYLGLFHTHNNVSTGTDNACYPPDGALNNSDCLATGDQICDTWPDPNFAANSGACQSPTCIYQTAPACCGVLTISDAAGTNYGGGKSTILRNNIMSYNSFSGCRTDFSPCQYLKVHDVLLSCRNNLCDDNVERHFSSAVVNDANAPYKNICTGDAIPTFNALPGGCYNWYTVATGGTPVATGTSTFTPTAAQLDVNTPGTTFFYIEEVNSYNAACRQVVEVVVSPTPGDGEEQGTAATSIALGAANNNICVTTVGANLGTDELVGWWLTHGSPVSAQVSDQSGLDALLSTAVVNGTVATIAPNHVFESVSGSPLREVCIDLDCAVLDSDSTYFLTPFVSTKKAAVPDANCVVALGISNITVSGNPGKRGSLAIGGVPCRPASPLNDPVFTLTITISGYTGAANNLLLRVRNNTTCALPNDAGGFVAGNGIYTFTEADFAAGFDPANTGWCILAFENGGSGMSGATMTASLDITYPGAVAVNFPTVSYTSCVFGNSISLNCPNVLDISTGAGCYNGIQAGVSGSVWHNILDGSGNIIAAINPNGNDLGTVTVDINDMASVLQDGDGRFYIPRYWNFESSNFNGVANPFTNGPINVRIYFLDTELTDYNTAASASATAADLNLTHYAGSNENCDILDNDYSSGNVDFILSSSVANSTYNGGSGNGYQLEFQLSHFSELGASGDADALPLHLLHFTGKALTTQVQLDWIAENEANTDYYVVERSADNIEFFSIGQVTAKGSSGQNSYTFMDAMPQNGHNYYRLRQINRDGSFELSSVVVVSFSNQNDISIVPNPVKENFTLIYYHAESCVDIVSVYDIAGKLVHSQTIQTQKGMNYLNMALPDLVAGIYVLKLQQKEKIRIVRFSKHNRP